MAAVMLLDSDDTIPAVARPSESLDQLPWYQLGRYAEAASRSGMMRAMWASKASDHGFSTPRATA